MPIQTVAGDTITHACASCGAVQTTDASKLVLGGHVQIDDKSELTNPDMIALPACKCGSLEFLQRTHDEDTKTPAELQEKSHHHRHRRAVNLVAYRLASAGRVHPKCKLPATAKTPPDADLQAATFTVQA